MTLLHPGPVDAKPEHATWTGRLRNRATANFPPEQLLPDKQPVYVASWI